MLIDLIIAVLIVFDMYVFIFMVAMVSRIVRDVGRCIFAIVFVLVLFEDGAGSNAVVFDGVLAVRRAFLVQLWSHLRPPLFSELEVLRRFLLRMPRLSGMLCSLAMALR